MLGSWLKRLFGKSEKPFDVKIEPYTGPTPLPLSANDTQGREVPIKLPSDLVESMREYAHREVWSGYSDRDSAIEFVIEMFADEHDRAMIQPIATRLVDEELAKHALEAVTWLAVTDYDRLARAFAALERDGIVARENFTCCGTCGTAEIWDEIGVDDAVNGSKRGYAFFHQQDTERGVDGDGIYLNYGACAEGEAAAVAIGHEVVDHLERAGLRTHWDGDFGRRIGVSLDWKRRRRS